MKTLIVGAGYAGLNAFHELKSLIISDKREFIFYTAYIRKIIEPRTKYSKEIEFIKVEKVIDFDFKSKWVKTNIGEYVVDNLIIAAGCDKTDILSSIEKMKKKDSLTLTSENPLNEYLAIQLAFYFKKIGKDVKYHGNFLGYLGKNISNTIQFYMEKNNIQYCEKAEDVIPDCKPPYPFDFVKVNEYLIHQNSFVIGDLIKDFPKLGELAMRTGIYVGKYIKGKYTSPFKPIFITIIDTGREGIHIRSDKPWGGSTEIVKVSKIRQLMKRFIERYYLLRNGKMGLLYYL